MNRPAREPEAVFSMRLALNRQGILRQAGYRTVLRRPLKKRPLKALLTP